MKPEMLLVNVGFAAPYCRVAAFAVTVSTGASR